MLDGPASVGRCVTLHLRRQRPRNQFIRAEDDHEAARDYAAAGEHDNDPAGRKEKETYITNIFVANDYRTAHVFPRTLEAGRKSSGIRNIAFLPSSMRAHVTGVWNWLKVFWLYLFPALAPT